MEPMTLGSTPSSPTSPGVNQGFLPSFLIGDIPPSMPHNVNVSPRRNKTPVGFKNNSCSNEPKSLRQKLFNQSLAESPLPSSSPLVNEKVGPPKTGLFDSLDSTKRPAAPILSSTAAHNEPILFNESLSRINPEESFYASTSFNSSRVNRSESHWVTVFGFPPSMLNQVLSEFSNCGVIVEKYMPPQGNFVHVRFNNLTEVSRALALNGKFINSNIMIGVQLRNINENKENSTSITSPNRARSLRHSFVSPHASNNVVPSQSVPQKSTGIVSKAMEYVFGW